jgi:hypothetical protein
MPWRAHINTLLDGQLANAMTAAMLAPHRRSTMSLARSRSAGS